MAKIIAIHSGGDWYDAEARYIVLLKEVDLNIEKNKYEQWYETHQNTKRNRFLNFYEWLIENGVARQADENEVEVFIED